MEGFSLVFRSQYSSTSTICEGGVCGPLWANVFLDLFRIKSLSYTRSILTGSRKNIIRYN